MNECSRLETLIAPFVDDAVDASERTRVSAHLESCPRCYSRVAAERQVRDLLARERTALRACVVSEALRQRCAASAHQGAPSLSWRDRLTPYALAASLVLAVGGVFLYQATARSSRVMAAELVLDHVKCFKVNHLARLNGEKTDEVQQWMETAFGWHADLPGTTGTGNLKLTAARPCLYGEGRVAHLMYEHNGRDVSVYMLPDAVRQQEVIEVLGHEASIWSASGRTFVVMSNDPAEVQLIARSVQASFR